MSLIATRLSLRQVCTIERDAATGSDGRGQPSDPDWQPHLENEPCRFWADAGRESIEGQGTVEPVLDLRLVLRGDADVTAADRVVSILYRGETAQDGPLGIRAVLRRPDHIELVLVKV